MRFNRLPKFITVSAESDEELDYKIDVAARKIKNAKGEIKDIHWHNDKPLHVTLIAEVSEVIPETIQERYEAENCARHCVDCKCYEPSKDRRVKWTKCEHSSCGVSKDSWACEWFYIQLEKGEDIEVISPDRPIRIDSIRRMVSNV